MKTFKVTHYYEVEVEVEADTASEALEKSYWDDFHYTVTATFDRQVGGPNVSACNLDPLVEESESWT